MDVTIPKEMKTIKHGKTEIVQREGQFKSSDKPYNCQKSAYLGAIQTRELPLLYVGFFRMSWSFFVELIFQY